MHKIIQTFSLPFLILQQRQISLSSAIACVISGFGLLKTGQRDAKTRIEKLLVILFFNVIEKLVLC